MNRLTCKLCAVFTGMLDRHLPNRTKRLIFLASFSARLKESTSLDMETMMKLNQVMVLCNSESAMKLPVQLSKSIWHGRTTYDICQDDVAGALTRERLQRIAVSINNAMPVWLRYGDQAAVERDVFKLFDNRLALGL